MAREIDRVPIDEVETMRDPYADERCGVCSNPWKGDKYNGGRDHPPLALWVIMPIGTEFRPYLPMLLPPHDYPCHRAMPSTRPRTGDGSGPIPISDLGIVLSTCAYLRPERPGSSSLVVEANRAGKVKTGGMKITPDEACPPVHKRPGSRPQGRSAMSTTRDESLMIEAGPVPDKDIITRIEPGRNGHK